MSEVINSKKCSKCGEVKSLSEFHKQKDKKYGRKTQCKLCVAISIRTNKELTIKKAEKVNILSLKTCSKCNIKKPLTEYSKNVYSKDGVRPNCKECSTSQDKVYNAKNVEKIRIRDLNYRINNKELIKIREKKYYEENREYVLSRAKSYSKKNEGKISARSKKYRKTNKAKIDKYFFHNRQRFLNAKKIYYVNNRDLLIKKSKEYITNRLKTDSSFRMKATIRNRFRAEIKTKYKDRSWRVMFNLTGYSAKDYLDSFDKDLFEKYKKSSDYHIDHIIPVSIYAFTIQEDINKCWNPRNLRIILKKDNQSKSNSVDIDLIKKHDIKDLFPEGCIVD